MWSSVFLEKAKNESVIVRLVESKSGFTLWCRVYVCSNGDTDQNEQYMVTFLTWTWFECGYIDHKG
mgnify:CR=1 FL=1